MDQGSGNGTKLNNQLLTEEHRLKHGDILTFDTFNFMFAEPEMEQSDATVVQASGDHAAAFDMAFDEDDTEMLPDSDAATRQPASSPPARASSSDVTEEVDVSDIIDDIGNWGFEEDDSTSPPTTADETAAEPEPEKPAEKEKDPLEEGLVEKDKNGEFQPAQTMTPDEFDRLFAEMDEDKK